MEELAVLVTYQTVGTYLKNAPLGEVYTLVLLSHQATALLNAQHYYVVKLPY